MRLDDRIAALRSDDRLAALAARLGHARTAALRRRAHSRRRRWRARKADVPGAIVAGRFLRAGGDAQAVAARRRTCIKEPSRASHRCARGSSSTPAWSSRSFLSWRLYDVQARNGAALREARRSRSAPTPSRSSRGAAASSTAAGNVLVRSLPSESVYAVPREIVDADATAAKLAKIVGKLDPAVVAALHDRHLWFVWIARKVPHETSPSACRSLGVARHRPQRRRHGTARRYGGSASRRPCSASSAPMKTASTASSTPTTTCCAAAPAA